MLLFVVVGCCGCALLLLFVGARRCYLLIAVRVVCGLLFVEGCVLFVDCCSCGSSC